LGFWEGKEFRTLLTSNTVEIPREGAGQGLEQWMTLEQIRATHPDRPKRFPHRIERRQNPLRTAGYPTYAFEATRSIREEPKLLKKARQLQVKTQAKGYFTLVLHAHLPYVRHPENDFFLEEHWLFEAITETYLPILDMLERFSSENVDASLTMSLTPTLVAMLRDPVLVEKYARHLDRMCELARKEAARIGKDPEFEPVIRFYTERLEHFRQRFNVDYGRDLVGAFSRMEEAGHLEIIACAATHGFLPHLKQDPKTVWAQIVIGVEEHRKQIGRWPRGIWLPECAYFEGLDEMLAAAGIEFFFVDTHGIEYASAKPKMGPYAPIFTPGGVAAFGRDLESSVEVWSAKEGYPGDFAYRDFYRDIGFDLPTDYMRPYLDPAGVKHMTGFKYYRITGKSDHKEPYKRIWADAAVSAHADDFVRKRSAQITRLAPGVPRRPNVVSMYDAELFGQWWFEGPDWLEAILRRLPEAGIRPVTPSQYLAEYPIGQVAEPSTSSWGNKGYYEVWLCGENDWVYPYLHDVGRRMRILADRFVQPNERQRRLLNQTGRELLLAQASDWPFILSNRTSMGYARQRIHEHLSRFDFLARQLEESWVGDGGELERFERIDNIFRELDFRVWRS
jgi:1,4-alpha-glucan branching enzyme